MKLAHNLSLPERAKRLGVTDIEYTVIPGTEKNRDEPSRVATDDNNPNNIHTSDELLERLKKNGRTPFDYEAFKRLFL